MAQRVTARAILDNLPWLTLIALLGVFTAINPRFIGAYSLSNIFLAAAPLLTLSFGATFVILTGSIDLSVGAVVSAACVIYGMTFPVIGNWSILVAVLFGFVAVASTASCSSG